jgi:hypothetical protein
MYTLPLPKVTFPITSPMWMHMWMLVLVCTCSLTAPSLKKRGNTDRILVSGEIVLINLLAYRLSLRYRSDKKLQCGSATISPGSRCIITQATSIG